MSIVMLTSVVHAVNIRCEYNYTDSNGIRWHYNLSALTAGGGDYEASDNGGFRYALNVCRPPLSVCRPAGQPAPVGTGTAIKYWGLTPSQCSTPPCTTACALLGWGALGSFATRFSLIDPAEPNEGIRLTHVSLLSANATPSLPFTAGPAPPVPPAVDEWGQPRPPLLTVDLVCEPTAPIPAAPMQVIALSGQQPGDTTLKLRTPYACPTHSSERTPTARACKTAALTGYADEDATSAEDAGADAATAVRARPSGGGWSWLAALLSCVILGSLLFFVFSPVSLRSRLSGFQDSFAADGSWPRAMTGEDDDDALLAAGGPRVRRPGHQDIDYRAM